MSRKQRAWVLQDKKHPANWLLWREIKGFFFNFHIFAKLSETCFMNANDDFDGKRTLLYNTIFWMQIVFGQKIPKLAIVNSSNMAHDHEIFRLDSEIAISESEKFGVDTGDKI